MTYRILDLSAASDDFDTDDANRIAYLVSYYAESHDEWLDSFRDPSDDEDVRIADAELTAAMRNSKSRIWR